MDTQQARASTTHHPSKKEDVALKEPHFTCCCCCRPAPGPRSAPSAPRRCSYFHHSFSSGTPALPSPGEPCLPAGKTGYRVGKVLAGRGHPPHPHPNSGPGSETVPGLRPPGAPRGSSHLPGHSHIGIWCPSPAKWAGLLVGRDQAGRGCQSPAAGVEGRQGGRGGLQAETHAPHNSSET